MMDFANMKNTITIEDLAEYDWNEALNYAQFSVDQIESIIASSEGENDGDYWLLVVHLKDGRFGYLSAGCDYTGWDCQAGGDSYIAPSLAELQRWNMTSRDRRRLGMELDDLDR